MATLYLTYPCPVISNEIFEELYVSGTGCVSIFSRNTRRGAYSLGQLADDNVHELQTKYHFNLKGCSSRTLCRVWTDFSYFHFSCSDCARRKLRNGSGNEGEEGQVKDGLTCAIMTRDDPALTSSRLTVARG
jgi:hypothetical protein